MTKAFGEQKTVGAARISCGPGGVRMLRPTLPRERAAAARRWPAWRTLAVGVVFGLCVIGPWHAARGAQWDPAAFAREDTLQLRTDVPGEGEYWFKVWLVVLDGQVYVRLGSRAAERVGRNTTAPYLGVEVAGTRFDKVRAVPAPEMAERVASAMADKYTSDLFIGWLPHPLTLRLMPES